MMITTCRILWIGSGAREPARATGGVSGRGPWSGEAIDASASTAARRVTAPSVRPTPRQPWCGPARFTSSQPQGDRVRAPVPILGAGELLSGGERVRPRDPGPGDGLGLRLVVRRRRIEQVEGEPGGQGHDRDLGVHPERARHDAPVGDVDVLGAADLQVAVHYAVAGAGIRARRSERVEGEQRELARVEAVVGDPAHVTVAQLGYPLDWRVDGPCARRPVQLAEALDRAFEGRGVFAVQVVADLNERRAAGD